jgi:hypothetical protein
MLSIEVSGLLVRRACAYDDGTDTITPSIECRLDVNPVRDEDGENNRRRGILRIPRDGEQRFHGIVNTDSTAT